MKQVLRAIAFILFLWVVMVASCKKDKPSSSQNFSPSAKAGFDQTITLPNDSTLLDGTGSSDVDGKITEWLWTIVSGPTSFTIVNEAVSKTVVKNLTAGIYKFQLKVTDDGGAVGRDTMQVSVIQPNRAPIAKAGADVSITLPSCSSLARVELDGSGSSDPDNSVISYLWTKIFGPASFNLRNSTIVKTLVENLVAGVYGFELQTRDPQGLISKDTVLVNVIGATPVEYNLDVSYNTTFKFLNNYEDCYYYYWGGCNYYDLTTIEATGSFGTIGQLNFTVYETADTASSSYANAAMSFWNDKGNRAYGTSNINFKKLIQNGGGAFTGTFTVNGGSAQGCNQDVFVKLAPLEVTGAMDTTAHTVILNIKGKIYF